MYARNYGIRTARWAFVCNKLIVKTGPTAGAEVFLHKGYYIVCPLYNKCIPPLHHEPAYIHVIIQRGPFKLCPSNDDRFKEGYRNNIALPADLPDHIFKHSLP